MDAESHSSLLEKASGSAVCHDCAKRLHKPNRVRGCVSWLSILLLHIIISCSAVAILVQIPTLAEKLSSSSLTFSRAASAMQYSPANSAIRYKPTYSSGDAWKHSLYTGEPSHASDAAWQELQTVRGVWVSGNEASRLNISGLFAGNGTTATLLGVQHNLHCVRFIRQVLYPEYYYPQQTEEEAAGRFKHAGHCLEAMRQSLMCTPDLTPRSVYWHDEERSNIAVNPSVKQQCLDWTSLVGWMKTRSYMLEDLWEANP